MISDICVIEMNIYIISMLLRVIKLRISVIIEYCFKVSPKEVAYNFPVTMSSTYGNSIYPGNYIDLYFQYRESGGGKLTIGKFIESIKVEIADTKVLDSLTPGQNIIKIVNEKLTEICLHEIGHALGLWRHSFNKNSIISGILLVIPFIISTISQGNTVVTNMSSSSPAITNFAF